MKPETKRNIVLGLKIAGGLAAACVATYFVRNAMKNLRDFNASGQSLEADNARLQRRYETGGCP